MPFKSKAQMRGAFSGALGPEMKAKAHEWAHATPNLKSLPDHALSGLKRAKVTGSKSPAKGHKK